MMRKRIALASLVFILVAALTGCRDSAVTTPEGSTRSSATDRYWATTIALARNTIDQIQLLQSYGVAFAQGTLSTEAFVKTSLSFSEDIARLVEGLIAASPPPRALENNYGAFVSCLDALTQSVKELKQYEIDGDQGHLLTVFQQLQMAREGLAQYVAGVPGSAGGDVLRERLRAMGILEIEGTPQTGFAVYLGPYDSLDEAKAVGATLPEPTEPLDTPPYLVPVGRADNQMQVDEMILEWQGKGYPVIVREEPVYQFSANVIEAPTARLWRQPAWQLKLDFSPKYVAMAPALAVAAASDGSLQAVSSGGQTLWRKTLSTSISGLALSANGQRLLVAGFDLSLLDGDGQVLWTDPEWTGDNLIEETKLSADGTLIVARSTNANERGRVYAFSDKGRLWRTKEDVAAAAVAVDPAGRWVLVASHTSAESRLVVVNRVGERVRDFAIPGEPLQLALSRSGTYTAVLTETELWLYDIELGQPLWHAPVNASLVRIGTTDDLILVGGESGLGVYSPQGELLWSILEPPLAAIAADDEYVLGLSDLGEIVLYSQEGVSIGSISVFPAVRDFRLLEDHILALDGEQTLYNWQLPAASELWTMPTVTPKTAQ